MEYTLSQIFVIISYIFLGLTYLQNKRKNILMIRDFFFDCIGNILFFLVSIYRSGNDFCCYYKKYHFFCEEKKNQHSNKINRKDIYILIILYCFTVFFAIYTYEGFGSIFSILETVIYTFSVWFKDPKVYKYLGIPTSIFCLSYHIYVRSIFGIILESILLITEIIGIVTRKEDKANTMKYVKFLIKYYLHYYLYHIK